MSYSLENSLRELLFREDQFLYNCLQGGQLVRAESTSTVASLGVPSREEVEFAQRDYLKVSTKHMFTCHLSTSPSDCRYSLGKLGLGLGTKFVPGVRTNVNKTTTRQG